MRQDPGTDHLDLWRGIDDAVWREAPSVAPVPRRSVPLARLSGFKMEKRALTTDAGKIPEPV